jgi:hypothetical protein
VAAFLKGNNLLPQLIDFTFELILIVAVSLLKNGKLFQTFVGKLLDALAKPIDGRVELCVGHVESSIGRVELSIELNEVRISTATLHGNLLS